MVAGPGRAIERKDMMDDKYWEPLRAAYPEEYARFRSFLDTHQERRAELGGKTVSYYSCGQGQRTLLTFAGGWGGIELAYETVLFFSGTARRHSSARTPGVQSA
jgi:hypothetical protein